MSRVLRRFAIENSNPAPKSKTEGTASPQPSVFVQQYFEITAFSLPFLLVPITPA